MKLSAAAEKFVFSVSSKSAGTIKGTGKTTLPLRDAVREAEEHEVETVSDKTVKNHFSRMSAIWSELVRRDCAPKNPWANWSFDLTQKTNRRAWSEEELRTLLNSKWLGRVFPERTYRGIVLIALYTGMRLGEICNLRNQDIEILNGIPCFQIRPHTVEIDGKIREWSPKTSAGTRIVPIHSKLLEKGIIEEFRNSGPYLFSELPISASGVRGANFEMVFSKHKRRLNLPADVTFHSFRHLVSTVLRNQDTGITQEMVAGKTIAPEEVARFAAQAALIVAHNARFDRLFAERFWEGFSTVPWACSMEDVPWQAEGFEGRSLGYLVMQAGWFFNGHRAVDDCLAGVTLLTTHLPKTQIPALSALLQEARQPRWQIWAENAPFDVKDKLKTLGYRWNDGTDGCPKAWFTEVPQAQKEDELHFLKTEIYLREVALLTREVTAWDRFSVRA